MIKKIHNILHDRVTRFNFLSNIGLFNFIPDEQYLKKKYSLRTRQSLNVNNPTTFNEKLQWLKLYDHNSKYTEMVDKSLAKKYVVKALKKAGINNPEQYIIPTLGIYKKFEDIDFNKLPNQFVIKCTHDSGGLVIVKSKNDFLSNKQMFRKAKKKINKSLKRNYYYSGREWPYKNVKPQIIIEQYMEDTEVGELRDYKIYSFDGKNDYVMFCFDRFSKTGTKFIYYDKKWNMKKDFSRDGIKYGDKITARKPANLEKMFTFAEILSKGIPFVRVDFYEVEGKLYFGELTFYPSSGFDDTRPTVLSTYLNKHLDITEIKEKK